MHLLHKHLDINLSHQVVVRLQRQIQSVSSATPDQKDQGETSEGNLARLELCLITAPSQLSQWLSLCNRKQLTEPTQLSKSS